MAKERIDNIAKYRQQSRGPPPKRRTDFSIFLCPSSSKATPDALGRSSSHDRDGLSSVSTTRLNKLKDTGNGPTGCTLIPCRNQRDPSTQLSDTNVLEKDKVDPSQQTDPFPERDPIVRTQEDVPWTLEQQDERSSDICMTPVSNEKDDAGSRRRLFKTPDRRILSDQQQSSGGMTLSNSTELEDESSERGRGKRKRKPKVHFDEEPNLPLKSSKKIRRFRIMRYLGLMAPLGSPF